GQGVRPCVPQRTVVLGEGVEMTFSFIPPGSFLMGSGPVQRGVKLTEGFWLAIQPVTQKQWRAVTRKRPSRVKGADRAVERVSWEDCKDCCARMGEKTNRRFRLPTEPEWEYACRAGTTTAYYTGQGLEALQRAGWCSYDGTNFSARETKAVGGF